MVTPYEILPNDDRSRLSRIGATGEDVPMTLKEACSIVFRGTISPATLKAEAERGNLKIRKIGRTYFVTWRELSLMWEKCVLPTLPQRERKPIWELSEETRRQHALIALDYTLKKLRKRNR